MLITNGNLGIIETIKTSCNDKTKSLSVINELENEIVNGNTFYVDNLFSMNTNDIIRLGIITPIDKDIRLYPVQIGADANYVKLEIYENATFVGMDELMPINANRQSINVSGVTVYNTFDNAPSIIGATKIDTFATLGGENIAGNSLGSKETSIKFIVLKRSTKYLFINTNLNGDNVTVLGKKIWIETDLVNQGGE